MKIRLMKTTTVKQNKFGQYLAGLMKYIRANFSLLNSLEKL